jgi:hypothetical protein
MKSHSTFCPESDQRFTATKEFTLNMCVQQSVNNALPSKFFALKAKNAYKSLSANQNKLCPQGFFEGKV